MIQREFKIRLHAGHSTPLVINCNQFDCNEQWLFTLYNGPVKYIPATGAIVGIKSDNLGIINSGTVDSEGRVVINQTQQMTAAVGRNVFELLIDDNKHGTANFVVLVEPRPGNNADMSDSDISLIQEAIEAAGTISSTAGMADTVRSLKSQMETFIADHAGLSTETVLWTGELGKIPNGSTQTVNSQAILSQAVSDFDYIVLYTTVHVLGDDGDYYTPEVRWYNAADFRDNTTVVVCGTTQYPMTADKNICIPYLVVEVEGTGTNADKCVKVLEAELISWSGEAGDSTETHVSYGNNNYTGYITKIIGVKNTQSDAEVTNARVGADGTSYSTLKARLDAENSSLKSAIDAKTGLSEEFKNALYVLVNHLAFEGNDPNGQTYIDALYTAMYPPTNLVSISAVYNQSGAVYTSDTLYSLEADLTVTAHYSDNTSGTVTGYSLSGTLTVGTSTITVSYGGKTTTFTVTVSEAPSSTVVIDGTSLTWEYGFIDANGNLSTTQAATGTWSSDYFSVSGYGDYELALDGSGVQRMAFYDMSHVFISRELTATGEIPSGAYYARATVSKGSLGTNSYDGTGTTVTLTI